MVSYEKVCPGKALEVSREQAIRRTSVGLQEEGQEKTYDISCGAAAPLLAGILARERDVVLLPKEGS